MDESESRAAITLRTTAAAHGASPLFRFEGLTHCLTYLLDQAVTLPERTEKLISLESNGSKERDLTQRSLNQQCVSDVAKEPPPDGVSRSPPNVL